MHGILILICVVSIPNILNMIPLASLAAILLVVGYKLAKPVLFREMYSRGWFEFIPFMATILGIVFTDLLTGIGLGMVVAVINILTRNYQIPFFFNAKDYKPGDIIQLELSEHVTFLNKAGIQKSLMQLPKNSEVLIDGSRTLDIHPDVLEIIADFEENAKGRDIIVNKKGLEQFMTEKPMAEFESAIVPEHKRSRKNLILKSLLP